MNKSIFYPVALLGLCFLLTPQQAHAQSVSGYGISAVGYNSVTREIFGYSATYLDYGTGFYYDPAVKGELYWQFDNEVPLDQGYSQGFSDWIPAQVWTYSLFYRPRTRYEVYSAHYVIAYYYYGYCSGFTSGCYSDPYLYSGFLGGNYGGFFGFPGFGFNPGYYAGSLRYVLGTTGVSITTPDDEACLSGASFDASGTPCTKPPPQPRHNLHRRV